MFTDKQRMDWLAKGGRPPIAWRGTWQVHVNKEFHYRRTFRGALDLAMSYDQKVKHPKDLCFCGHPRDDHDYRSISGRCLRWVGNLRSTSKDPHQCDCRRFQFAVRHGRFSALRRRN